MTDAQTIERPDAGTELAIIGAPVTALTVFGTEGGVDAILAKITAQARAVDTDISTPAGRKAVASLAYKIARSKSALDELGKELGEQNYRAWKAITSERARIGKALDELGADIRRPLTEFEEAERARIKAHEDAIDHLIEGPQFYAADNSSEDLARRLRYLESILAEPARDWQEFAKRAAVILAAEIVKTKAAILEAVRREAAAELAARLAREEAEAAAAREAERQRQREVLAAANARREAEERARVAAEATERRVAAERHAEAERVAERVRVDAEHLAAVERQKQEAIALAESAKRDAADLQAKAERDRVAALARAEAARVAAAEQAERDKQAAIEAERQRIADAQARDAAETAKREANRRHRGQINGEARDALVKEGLSEQAATAAVTAIARGAIPHCKIGY